MIYSMNTPYLRRGRHLVNLLYHVVPDHPKDQRHHIPVSAAPGWLRTSSASSSSIRVFVLNFEICPNSSSLHTLPGRGSTTKAGGRTKGRQPTSQPTTTSPRLQRWVRERALGCVNSSLMGRGSQERQEAGFTQPGAHSSAQLCTNQKCCEGKFFGS